jgi:hypothetical protein
MSGKGAFGPYSQVVAPGRAGRPGSDHEAWPAGGHQVIVRALLSCQISLPEAHVTAG